MNDNTKNTRPIMHHLHPRVYGLIVGFAIWLALSVWFFAGAGVTDYLLVIVCGFVFIAVGLPFVLSRVARRDDTWRDSARSFHDWAQSEFDAGQGHLSGTNAMVQILLPIAAVALGMMIFGITLHFATAGIPLHGMT